MRVRCPACLVKNDQESFYCSSCGSTLALADGDTFVPLPGLKEPVDLRIRKRRVPWYRRPRLVVSLMGLGLAAAGVAALLPT